MNDSVLETLRVVVPGSAAALYEAALAQHCRSVASFMVAGGAVEIEGVRERGAADPGLTLALALAAAASGVARFAAPGPEGAMHPPGRPVTCPDSRARSLSERLSTPKAAA